MSLRRLYLIGAALLLAALPPSNYSQISTADQRLPQDNASGKALQALVSTNKTERLKAAAQLDEQRSLLLQRIIAIVENTNYDNGIRMDAVIVLGEYRGGPVRRILEHLEWDNTATGGITVGKSREEVEDMIGSVSQALQKIGMPSIAPLMDRITQTDDTNLIIKCVSICAAIEGPEVTQFRLEKFEEKESDSKRKDRIQSALAACKQLASSQPSAIPPR